MGYTIYWQEATEGKQLAPEFLDEVREVIDIANAHGISIRGGQGDLEPIVNSNEVWLNGDESLEQNCETFSLGGHSGFQFCKTRRLPYTFVVAKILAIAATYGYVSQVEHDGSQAELDALVERWDKAVEKLNSNNVD